jgi:hypothetical protein
MHKVLQKEAVKKYSLAVLRFVIILIPSTVLLLLFHFDIDFLWDSSGWKMILDGKDYYLLDIRKSDNPLFLVEGIFRDTTITI